jgi:hypothetical protein
LLFSVLDLLLINHARDSKLIELSEISIKADLKLTEWNNFITLLDNLGQVFFKKKTWFDSILILDIIIAKLNNRIL